MTRLLVTGASGMLGLAVASAGRRLGLDVTALGREELDITALERLHRVFGEAEPHAVVNCAAYTDVDGAESDEAAALAINGDGAGNVAAAAGEIGAHVVHVSTDYVFDGSKRRPWVESDAVAPLGAYGRSKLAGETAVAAAHPGAAIVRTAWLFGPGGKNFVDTMLGFGQARDEISVVTDQTGSPTFTGHLAGALVELAQRPAESGIHHIAGAGACSWNELTLEAFEQAGVACRVLPTTSDAFPRPAARPAYSVLGSERPDPLVLPKWQDGVRDHLNARVPT